MVLLKKAVLLLIIFFSLNALAQPFEIRAHTIDIKVDEKGFGKATERFFLDFPGEEEIKKFKEESAQKGVSLESWKAFDERIHTYIGEEKDLDKAQVGFVESEDRFLEINYGLKTPIMYVTGETSRRTEFRLKENFFRAFLVGTLWIIPDNTIIRIELPSQAEIQGKVKPDATVEGNKIIMQGYKSSNLLEIKYRIWKQIAGFDLQKTIQEFLNSEMATFLGVIVFVIVIVAYVKRKSISQKIENYIVEHSELAPKEQ